MINMFLNVTNRTSSAIESLQVDALNKQAIVSFKDGNTYAYGNVSTRAIINVLFNPDVSLGFWVNNNLLKSERTELLNGDQFDYSNWADGEPNDADGAEDFIHMWADGTWNDHESSYEVPFIVETKAAAPVEISNLTYDYNTNGGNCQTLSVSGLTDQNGSALVGGETAIHAQLEFLHLMIFSNTKLNNGEKICLI